MPTCDNAGVLFLTDLQWDAVDLLRQWFGVPMKAVGSHCVHTPLRLTDEVLAGTLSWAEVQLEDVLSRMQTEDGSVLFDYRESPISGGTFIIFNEN